MEGTGAGRRALLTAGGLLVIALLLRLLPLLGGAYTPRTDALDFDRHGASIAAGHGYPDSAIAPGSPTAFRPPGLPVLLAGVYAVTGNTAPGRWEAARLSLAVLGVVAVGLVGLLAFELFGSTVALLATALAAVYPPLIAFGSSILSEPLLLVLELGGIIAALRARRSSRPLRWWVAAGLLVGLAALTRSNGALLLIPLLVAAWRPGGAAALPWPRAAAGVLVAMAVVILPWTARNAVVTGRLVPVSTQGGFALAGTYNSAAAADRVYPGGWRLPIAAPEMATLYYPGISEKVLDQRLGAAARTYMFDHPLYPLGVIGWNALRAFDLLGPGPEADTATYLAISPRLIVASVYATWVLLVLALPGALLRRAREAPAFVWLVPLLVVIGILPISGLMRYRLPADPFLLILAALVLTEAGRRLRRAPG